MDSASHNKPTKHHQPSTSELMSSAKYLAEAAKATFNHESHPVDKAKVAGAAEDLLSAASHYGKLEGKSMGKYVEKAENYLHQYHSSHSTATTDTTTGHPAHGGGHSFVPSGGGHSSVPSGGGDGKSGSGYGEYLKMAEGFLKKH